jgi:hypothetical protein
MERVFSSNEGLGSGLKYRRYGTLSKTRTLRLAVPNGSLQQPAIDMFYRAAPTTVP